MKNLISLIALFVISIGLYSDSFAQSNPDPERFNQTIKSFMDWDLKNSFPEDAILFIGSSSIYMWSTRENFPDLPVINRGIQGALISDINYYIRAIVLKYRPKVIVFYGGENDIVAGKGPSRIKTDFEGFAAYVNKVLPKTIIACISLKPTLSRLSFWPKMKELNENLKKYAAENDYLYFLDYSKQMIDEEGQPKFEYFRGDGLHLNSQGYSLWEGEIRKLIKSRESADQ